MPLVARPASISGFGQTEFVPVELVEPKSADELGEALGDARANGRQVVLRGAGRSYGDAAYLANAIALDFRQFNRIIDWNPESGVVTAEPGTSLQDLWRCCLPDGWWLPVTSGTMFPSLGGALAMNIHGKNAFREGTLAEHLLGLEVLFPNGETVNLSPEDDLLYNICSSAGLLGVIVKATLQLKRVESGCLEVYAASLPDWNAQFHAFETHREDADYMVSWIDAFSEGRGLFHAARHIHNSDRPSLAESSQDLPSRAFGVLPKSQVWRLLRLANHRFGMRAVNAAKHWAGRAVGNGHTHRQSLIEFSYLLDYLPGWERAYRPGGFIQYQCFVPEGAAPEVFPRLLNLQQSERRENFLTVMKRHRPDPFLFSHGVEGYSLAMDFKVRIGDWDRILTMCHRMNDIVLDAGGRFYFAKDSTLRPSDLQGYLGETALARYRDLKRQYDPENLLSSALAKRTGLDPS